MTTNGDTPLVMNSAAIRHRHLQRYEEFFQTCPTVVSVPAALLWSPNYAVGPGGIGMMSKLPLRVYVGFEPTPDDELSFGPSVYYVPEEDHFAEWDSSATPSSFIPLLKEALKDSPKKISGRIWILSEIPWYRGLMVDSLVGAAVAAVWLLATGTVTPVELENVVSESSERLAASPVFDKLLRLAWRLDSSLAHWLSDAHPIFGALVDSAYPTVFFRERDPFTFEHFQDYGINHPSSYYNVSDGLFYRGARMNELFQLDQDPVWPLDMALVYIGEAGDSQFVYRTRGAFRARLEEAAAFTEKTLKPLVPESFRQTPRFLQLMSHTEASSVGMNLMRVYREASVVHSMTVLKTLHDLFQFGASPEILRAVLDAQNLSQDILRLLGLSSLTVDAFCTTARMAGMKHSEEGVAARLPGQGMYGCLLMLGPRGTLAQCIEDMQSQFQSRTGRPMHIHWCSWRDGMNESRGVRVEQHIESGRYASLTNGHSLTAQTWQHGETAPRVMLYTVDRWDHERAQFDLVMDAHEGKIFVRGRALTSEEIFSVKQTIELFRFLISKRGEDLPAMELPESCYRSDRNQMESKIIRPLVEAVRKVTDRVLGLEIHGGLRSQYVVRFKPDAHLRVAFVEERGY